MREFRVSIHLELGLDSPLIRVLECPEITVGISPRNPVNQNALRFHLNHLKLGSCYFDSLQAEGETP